MHEFHSSSDTKSDEHINEGLTIPRRLLEEVEIISNIRTQTPEDIVKNALLSHLDSTIESEQFQKHLERKFYRDELSYEDLVTLVGRRRAQTYQYFKERLDRESSDLPGNEAPDDGEDIYGDFDITTAPTPTETSD